MKTLKAAHKTEITSVINPTNYRIHLNKCIRKKKKNNKTNKATHHNVSYQLSLWTNIHWMFHRQVLS